MRKSELNNIRQELEELEGHIITVNKEKVPGHKFIKTISVGRKNGHILYGKKSFWLCLRKSNEVSYNELDGYVFGFERKTMEAIEDFADELNASNVGYQKSDIEEPKATVKQLVSDEHYWIYRVKDQCIIHTITGVVFPICLPMQNIRNLFGLSKYNLHRIVEKGIVANHFALYTERLDGKSWESVIGKKLKFACYSTENGWGCKQGGRPYVSYKNLQLQRGVATIEISNRGDGCAVIGADSLKIAEVFRFGGETLVYGWKLKTK